MSELLAPALLLLGVSGGLVLVGYGAAFLLRVGPQRRDVMPYLSGSLPLEHAVSRYHVRWYAVSMVFLAFDMEMVFMYPWVLVVRDRGVPAVVEMFGFLAVLFGGIWYAWREGALRWT